MKKKNLVGLSSSSSVRNVNSFESVLVGRLTDLRGGSGRLPQQHVNLLLDPLLVVRRVRVGRLLVHEAAQVRELVNKIKQLANVVGDGGRVRVAPLQVLLVDLAHALHALVYALVVAVRSRLRIPGRLNEQNRVRHLVYFPFLAYQNPALVETFHWCNSQTKSTQFDRN